MELTALLPGPVGQVARDDQDLTEARNAADADFESFLKLLTAQLENQDPLEPLDSTQFVEQLASFSTVEQLVSANERLDALALQSATGDIASFASWIGREVAAADGTFRATGDPQSFAVPTLEGAERIEAVVRDQLGIERRRLTIAADETGRAIWDGRDAQGDVIIGPDMKIDLNYIQGGSITETRTAEVLRLVTGLRGSDDGVVLDLADGASLAPEAVSRLQAALPE